MKAKEERYNIGEELSIDIIPQVKTTQPYPLQTMGIIIMGGEEKTEGAKEGSDEEYSHKIREGIEFKDVQNLELFQIGIELMQMALFNESEHQED